jgi:hypothetical protein
MGAVTRGYLNHVRARFPAGGEKNKSQPMPVTSLCI